MKKSSLKKSNTEKESLFTIYSTTLTTKIKESLKENGKMIKNVD